MSFPQGINKVSHTQKRWGKQVWENGKDCIPIIMDLSERLYIDANRTILNWTEVAANWTDKGLNVIIHQFDYPFIFPCCDLYWDIPDAKVLVVSLALELTDVSIDFAWTWTAEGRNFSSMFSFSTAWRSVCISVDQTRRALLAKRAYHQCWRMRVRFPLRTLGFFPLIKKIMIKKKNIYIYMIPFRGFQVFRFLFGALSPRGF